MKKKETAENRHRPIKGRCRFFYGILSKRKPEGVDFAAAKERGLHAIHAPGLPGKIAPKAAAGYMKHAIYHAIKEMG